MKGEEGILKTINKLIEILEKKEEISYGIIDELKYLRLKYNHELR